MKSINKKKLNENKAEKLGCKAIDALLDSIRINIEQVSGIKLPTDTPPSAEKIDDDKLAKDIRDEDDELRDIEQKIKKPPVRPIKVGGVVSGPSSFKEFEKDLKMAMRLQAEEVVVRNRSKTVIDKNREVEDPKIIRPGIRSEVKIQGIPHIAIFQDWSGSWDNAEKLSDKIVSMLLFLSAKGLITVSRFYFCTQKGRVIVSETKPSEHPQGGTQCWPQILDKILEIGATNVVIITDSDMYGMPSSDGRRIQLPGVVWYLWHGNSIASDLPKALYGGKNKDTVHNCYTRQYSFTDKDAN